MVTVIKYLVTVFSSFVLNIFGIDFQVSTVTSVLLLGSEIEAVIRIPSWKYSGIV